MNKHGRHAMETMKSTDQEQFSQIEDPEAHFTQLGQEMADEIGELATQLTPPRVHGQNMMDVIGLQKAATKRAEEVVYQERIYSQIPPQSEEMETTPLPSDEE